MTSRMMDFSAQPTIFRVFRNSMGFFKISINQAEILLQPGVLWVINVAVNPITSEPLG